MNGIAPYSFGIFVPSGGVYGRHNREYAPPELAEIGAAAGFETTMLRTVDVYDRDMDPGTAEMLVGREDNLALRGETIFYLAQKTGDPAGTAMRFYHGDPSLMSAAFHPGPREAATGLISLGLENRSGQWWPVEGERATCLLAEWIDPEGVLIHQSLIQPLRAPVAPGEVVTDAPLSGPNGDTWLINEVPGQFTLVGFGDVALPQSDGIARIGINSRGN